MTISEFLPDYCSAIKLLLDHQKGYHTYGPICSGIELLGRCIDDEKSFSKPRIKGSKSFNRAIIELMPKYAKVNKKYNLYANLRNNMLHTLLPGKNIWMVENYSKSLEDIHLCVRTIKNIDGLVLNANEFFEDFELACKVVIKKISDQEIKTKKLTTNFISTIESK